MKQNVARELRLGALDVDGSITKITGEVFKAPRLNTSSVQNLITENAMNFRSAVNYVNREIRNMVVEAQKETDKINVIDTVNRKQFEEELKKQLVNRGVVAMKTSNNRELILDKYVKMATQTTLKIARNVGVIEQSKKRGIDLVKMTEHFPTCSICMVRQGRVYSISGENKDYPSLYGDCFTGDYETVHPNCKHSYMPYLPEYLSEEQVKADKEYSNRPFEVLNEFEQKQLERYNTEQKRKSRINRIRKEYDNMAVVVGSENMPSFTGFRNSKTRNGPVYKDLKEQYNNLLNPKEDITPVIEDKPMSTMLDNEALYEKFIDGDYFSSEELDYITDWRTLGKENIVAKRLYNEKGFNAKPQLMDAEEFEKLDRDEYEIVFRGVANNNEAGITAYEINEQFKTGDLYYGSGLYGGGTYTTGSKNMAIHYGADDVMVMAFRKDAKIVNYSEVAGFSNDNSKKRMFDFLSDVKHNNRTRAMTEQELIERKILGDQDVLLSSTNADIVRVGVNEWKQFFNYDTYEELHAQFGDRINKDYYVILNRGSIIVRR